MAILFKIRNMESNSTNKLYKISNKPSGDMPWWKQWLKMLGFITKYQNLEDWLAHSDEALYEWQIRGLMTCHETVDFLKTHFEEDTSEINQIIFNNHFNKWITLRPYALDTLSTNPIVETAMQAKGTYVGVYNYDKVGDDVNWGLVNMIPKMTSSTAPYGYVTSLGTVTSGHEPWMAFDGNDDTYCELSPVAISGTTINTGIGYATYNAMEVRRVKIVPGPFTGSAKIGIYSSGVSSSYNAFPSYKPNYVKVGEIVLTSDGQEHYIDLDLFTDVSNQWINWYNAFTLSNCPMHHQTFYDRSIKIVYEEGTASKFAIKHCEFYGRYRQGLRNNRLSYEDNEKLQYKTNPNYQCAWGRQVFYDYYEYEYEPGLVNDFYVLYDHGVYLNKVKSFMTLGDDIVQFKSIPMSTLMKAPEEQHYSAVFYLPVSNDGLTYNGYNFNKSNYQYMSVRWALLKPSNIVDARLNNLSKEVVNNCVITLGRNKFSQKILSELYAYTITHSAYTKTTYYMSPNTFCFDVSSTYAQARYLYQMIYNKKFRDKLVQYLLEDNQFAKWFFNSTSTMELLTPYPAMVEYFKSFPAFREIMDNAGLKFSDNNGLGAYKYGQLAYWSGGDLWANSDYLFFGLVPNMTSKTLPYGKVVEGTPRGYDTRQAYEVFDKFNNNNYYELSTTNGYVGYEFPWPVNVVRVAICGESSGSLSSANLGLQYSIDGTTWVDVGDVFEVTNGRGVTSPQVITLPNDVFAKSWRIINKGFTIMGITQLQFYGRRDVSTDCFGLESRIPYDFKDVDKTTKYVMLYDYTPIADTSPTKNTSTVPFSISYNNIDVTEFKKLRAIVPQLKTGTSYLQCGDRKYTFIESDRDKAPFNLELDISDLEGTYTVGLYDIPTISVHVCALWLER